MGFIFDWTRRLKTCLSQCRDKQCSSSLIRTPSGSGPICRFLNCLIPWMSHICVTHKMWLQRTQMTFSSPQINLIVLSLSWWQELRLTGNFYYLIHCGISVHISSRLYYISFKQIKVGGEEKKRKKNTMLLPACMLCLTNYLHAKQQHSTHRWLVCR